MTNRICVRVRTMDGPGFRNHWYSHFLVQYFCLLIGFEPRTSELSTITTSQWCYHITYVRVGPISIGPQAGRIPGTSFRHFRSYIHSSWSSNYNNCSPLQYFLPFVPQFFFLGIGVRNTRSVFVLHVMLSWYLGI